MGLNHRWCMRFHPPSPRRAQPGRIHCTAPPPYLTKPPLDHLSLHQSPVYQPRIVFLHYKPTSGLNFFLHRLGLRRCGGGGSAAHCFDAQPRTLLFCRHHSSTTPRCNRAPGHTPHAVVWLEKRAFTVVSPKKSPKLPHRRIGARAGRLEQPSVFSLSPNPHHHHPLKPPSRTATLWH